MKVEFENDRYFRAYTVEEANGLFRAAKERIFVPQDQSRLFTKNDSLLPFFNNPDWKCIAISSCAYESMLSESPPGVPSDLPQHYVFFEDNEASDVWDVMRPLWIALIERGIDEVLHMPVFSRGSNIGAIATPPGSINAEIAYSQELFISMGAGGFMFSREESWGICTDLDFYTMLGGEPDFIDRIIELSGGLDILIQDLDAYWGKSSKRCEHPKNLAWMYECAGWEVPDFIGGPRKTPYELVDVLKNR